MTGGAEQESVEKTFLMSDEVRGEKGEKYFLWLNIFFYDSNKSTALFILILQFCLKTFFTNSLTDSNKKDKSAV